MIDLTPPAFVPYNDTSDALKRNASALRGLTAKQLSHRLSGMELKYKHTNHGNYYKVVYTDSALQPVEYQAV